MYFTLCESPWGTHWAYLLENLTKTVRWLLLLLWWWRMYKIVFRILIRIRSKQFDEKVEKQELLTAMTTIGTWLNFKYSSTFSKILLNSRLLAIFWLLSHCVASSLSLLQLTQWGSILSRVAFTFPCNFTRNHIP